MCGILFTDDPRISEEKFSAALDRLEHRGPDSRGCRAIGAARLGHTRLKIQDLDDRSNQPFYSRDGRYVVTFNGEIYNFQALAKQHNLSLRTTSDTEVLVELYAAHGSRMLPWLNGMFAFVILDTRTNEIFAARDRLGVKPLYFSRRNGQIAFASEIAALLELLGAAEFDEIGLRQYRKLRACFNGRTIYRGIEMFPAGHYFSGGKITRYWQLPETEQAPPPDEEIRELVGESVRARRIADVPIGSYLSGGLDSTIVAALAGEPHTWTVGFRDDNEFEWGRMAATAIGSTHHEVLITPEEFVALAKEMIRRRREPLSVPNEVLLYKMTREVRKLNTVILSGEGADELFFGYDRIFRWAAGAAEFDLREFARLYCYGSNEDLEIVEDAIAPFRHLPTPLATVAAFFQVAHLHGLLRRLDNSTMLCSVEARVPFVDHHPLVERMAGVPFDSRMAGGEVKASLKRAFAREVPEPIRRRAKIGFPVPLEKIPFGVSSDLPPMDRWLAFNLHELGLSPDSPLPVVRPSSSPNPEGTL